MTQFFSLFRAEFPNDFSKMVTEHLNLDYLSNDHTFIKQQANQLGVLTCQYSKQCFSFSNHKEIMSEDSRVPHPWH